MLSVLEKKTFQHFHHINAWGHKFDLALKKIKGQRMVIIGYRVPDAIYKCTKIQPESFLGSAEEDF